MDTLDDHLCSNESDFDTAVFIVRLWWEPREIQPLEPELRGSIEHVPSGRRRHYTRLESILDFIAPYAEGLKAQSK